MTKNKYYVVWKGRHPGVFDDWDVCKKEIIGCKGALYKGFPDLKSADEAFRMGYEAYRKANPMQKPEVTIQSGEQPITQAIAVDAACAGNPGKMEYRGVFVVTRMGSEDFSEDDIIVCEHAITCVSLVAMHVTEKEEAEAERKRQMVRMGFDTLSYSEMEAIGHVLMSMDRKEGLLVASKIADEAGITRSVIVNALRKLESAGLIATRSLGMKGTFIKVKNEFIFDELKVTK